MPKKHYYGDEVRILLTTAAILMLVGTPFFIDRIHNPTFFTTLLILVLVLVSGLINPAQKSVVALTTLVSMGSFVAFQYTAMTALQTYGLHDTFFMANEFLALLTLIATYFGTKSVRGLTQPEKY